MNERLKQLVEALVFAAPDPLDERRLAELLDEPRLDEIIQAIDTLNAEYQQREHAFHIIRSGGGYRFATRPEFGRWVKRMLFGSGRVRLSRAALETLSLIAYRQPVSRADIEAVRGVEVSGVLRMLVERKLIAITGRAPGHGRALLYETTPDFLRYFGIDSLDDLPGIDELSAGESHPAGEEESGELFEPEQGADEKKDSKPTDNPQ